MSGTATDSAPPSPTAPVAEPSPSPPRRTPLMKLLNLFASLRLTVVLLALGMVLVFVGTLAQVHHDIHTVTATYFRTPVAWIDPAIFLPPGREVAGALPFPGGYTLGGLLLLNLLAAHAVRFRLSLKRAGILVIHLGLIVLLIGELITGLFAVETQMALEQDRPINYVEHVHDAELAVVHTDAAGETRETLVPAALLRPGETLSHPLLPFDLHVDRYMTNSELEAADDAADDPPPDAVADARHLVPIELPRATGVDPQQRLNTPTAELTLHADDTGEPLGRYLVSWWLTAADRPQSVYHDGERFDLYLRYQRTYLPFTFELEQFEHATYPGTDIPRHFASRLHLVDPARGVDRQVTIEMNQPLRYAGRSFYQAAYMPDERTSVLQVVHNPGWLIPYLAGSLVALGLLIQFALSLTTFINRNRTPTPPPAPSAPANQKSQITRQPFPRLGIALLLLAVAWLAWSAWPLQRGDAQQMHLDAAAAMPVLEGGRIKPLDSVARVHLMTASHQQSFIDDQGRRQPAVIWLLDVLAGSERALQHRVYRIDHPQLLSMLELTPRSEGPRAHRYRFSLAEIGPHWQTIVEQADRARALAETDRDSLDRRLIALADQLDTFVALGEGEGLAVPAPPAAPAPPGHAAAGDDITFAPLGQTPHHGMMMRAGDAPGPPAVQAMIAAYRMHDAAAFNTALARQFDFVDEHLPGADRRTAFEAWFNHAAPFHKAAVLYLVSFLLLAGSWLIPAAARVRPTSLSRSALWLTLLAFAVHTAAILARMWLEGRPPVTNLYASAIFVGWGCAGLGLILHRLCRSTLGLAAATVIGFATLLIAHQLAQGVDTLEPVRAVLDANFFMATHVTTVTLGYTAMFVAGFLGIAFVARSLLARRFDDDARRQLARMTYGVLCFALLLSFTGTMLGGIWADQAWGRFWGWDPKENGALLIVLWCALILHARWGGLVGPSGIALAAIFGNVVTAWAWFGVNELGIGLHSYGFTEGAATALVFFALSQLLIIALGLVPTRYLRAPLNLLRRDDNHAANA